MRPQRDCAPSGDGLDPAMLQRSEPDRLPIERENVSDLKSQDLAGTTSCQEKGGNQWIHEGEWIAMMLRRCVTPCGFEQQSGLVDFEPFCFTRLSGWLVHHVAYRIVTCQHSMLAECPYVDIRERVQVMTDGSRTQGSALPIR